MAYVLQGVMGGFGYGGVGLGSDSKKDNLLIAKLRTQAAQGVPGAEQALNEAIQMAPAQRAYDAQADTMRAAAMPQIPKSPAAARQIALAALESTIKQTLGSRPTPHTPDFFAAQQNVTGGGGGGGGGGTGPGGPLDFLTGKTSIDVGGHQVSSTTLIVGALVIGGVLYFFTR